MRRATALAVALLLAGPVRADQRAELAGEVLDANGGAVAGADVVVEDGSGRLRRVVATDADGRFRIVGPATGGAWRLVVYRARGAEVQARLVSVKPGDRLWTIVTPDALTIAAVVENAESPVTPSAALARDRTIGDVVTLFAAGAPSSPATGGPTLAGVMTGELDLRLEGVSLRDPVDGQAPLSLPLALFGEVSAAPQTAGAPVSVRARAPTVLREREARVTLLGAGSDARTGGVSWSGGLEAVGGMRGERLGLVVAAAPLRAPWRPDPLGGAEIQGRRVWTVPALVRADTNLRAWALDALALASRTEAHLDRSASILPITARAGETVDLGLLSLAARRDLGAGDGELALRASGLGSVRQRRTRGAGTEKLRGGRLEIEAEVVGTAALGGMHALEAAGGLVLASARRRGSDPGRFASAEVVGGRASSTTPWIRVGDRYQPSSWLALMLGLHIERGSYQGRSRLAGLALVRERSTDVVFAPRARLDVHHPRGVAGAFLAVARVPTWTPLGPWMGAAAAPGALATPTEDVALVGARGRHRSVDLSLTSSLRRSRHVLEDRVAMASGRLELFQPEAERRYASVTARSDLRWRGGWGGAAVTRSWLRGDHDGFADPVTGDVRPAGTGAFDGEDVVVNRDGPLAADRPWGVRAFAEQRGWARGHELRAALGARLDAGTPLSALGRSARSGDGQVYLLRRGAYGRTPWTGGLDMRVSASRQIGAGRLTLSLELFDLLGSGRELARDQRYADRSGVAQEGAGRERAGELRSTAGAPLERREGFLRPLAETGPRLVRLLLTLAL